MTQQFQKTPVSVIVSMRNSETTIVKCLQGLTAQSYPIAELLVYDNVSSDRSCECVVTYQKQSPVPIQLIRLKFDGGLAASYNAGALRAVSPLLVFVHSDSMLPSSFELERLVFPLLLDGKVIASHSIILMPKEVWRRFPFWQKYLFARVAMREGPCMCGKFDCIRKEAFVGVGMHNEKRFTATCGYGGEDSDLNMRLSRVGRVVGSTARVIHLHDLSNDYGISALFRTRKMLARTYGKILRFQGPFPIMHKWPFFVKPALATVPFVLGRWFWVGILLQLLFSMVYNRTLYRSILDQFDKRVFVAPVIDIALLYFETFWFIEGLLTPSADARSNLETSKS